MVLPALEQGGYAYKSQVVIGKRLGGRNHKVDLLLTATDGSKIPVSMKWQQVSGTAEQKVPFEIMCLAEAVAKSEGKFRKAYLVLGGDGWTLRDFYLGDGLKQYLKNCESVEVVNLEGFVGKANQGKL
jgi:hypothetical protein